MSKNERLQEKKIFFALLCLTEFYFLKMTFYMILLSFKTPG